MKLGGIADISTGSTPSTAHPEYYRNGTVPWIASSATNQQFISQPSEYITETAFRNTRLRLYPKYTLLVALYGQGKTRGQVSELLIESATNQACAALVFDNESSELRAYVKLFLLKNYRELREQSAGGAQPNLNLNKIKQIILPLPPLAEQKRIVVKVDQLMSLCDELEARLAQAEAARAGLLNAAVRAVLAK